MTKILIIACVMLFNTICIAKDCDKLIQKESYVSCFNFKTKQPDYVKYELKSEEVKVVNTSGRSKINFHLDSNINKKYQLKPSDYYESGFDRGHLYANANSDFSYKSQYDSFSMVNITPQYPMINRYVYLSLEEYERELVYRYKRLIVYSGVINNIINDSKLDPPEYIYKVIHIPSINVTSVYIIPNVSNPQYSNYKKYVSDIQTIERLSGYTFQFQ